MKNLVSSIFKAIARYFLVIVGLVFFFIAALVGFIVLIEMQLPDVKVLKEVHLQVPLRIYSREGQLIAEYGAHRRNPVTLDQVPKPLTQAILATEDQRFYSHPGVDFIGLFRAFKVLLGTGQKSQGASTITMQVARNFFLSHKKTYIRKIREILLALKIERNFSKDKILELYLNRVYFGNRAYGVEAAANVYYGKTLSQLSLAEMAMIAGLPQAPSKNNPIIRPESATERRNHVLLRMLGVGDITKAEYEKAVREIDHARYHGPLVEVNAPYVGELVRQYLYQQGGEDIYDHGYSVYTTLSGSLQNAAAEALQNGLIDYTERHGSLHAKKNLGRLTPEQITVWKQKLNECTLPFNLLKPAAVLQIQNDHVLVLLADGQQQEAFVKNGDSNIKVGDVVWLRSIDGRLQVDSLPQIQGALVSLDPQTGAVLALVGGFDFNLSKFNRVTQAERQPGSVFKPFIYSAALEKGYSLASTINNAPIVVDDMGEDNFWRPHNDNRKFSGVTRLREGLIHSMNLVSIRLLEEIGIPYVIDFTQKFGFNARQLPRTLSLALGAGLASPMTVATAYSAFANGGYRITPYYIGKIVDENQKVLFEANPPTACADCITHPEAIKPSNPAPQIIDSQNAYLMTQALQDTMVRGTAKAARALQRSDLAGKTGTTNDKVDAWFAGFNSRIVTTVWIGYDNLMPTREYGSQIALSIWIQFMRMALIGMPVSTMPRPPGIVTARIDPSTGLLAADNQPNALFEVFQQGAEPRTQAVSQGFIQSERSSEIPGEIF